MRFPPARTRPVRPGRGLATRTTAPNRWASVRQIDGQLQFEGIAGDRFQVARGAGHDG